MQFYDSEIKVLNILWRYGELAAGEVAKILGEEEGWKGQLPILCCRSVLIRDM